MIPGAERGNFDHVSVLLAHLRLEWLLQHFSPRLVWTAYVCVNCFSTIGLLALPAFVTGSPFVFPSLGPTAYLFFFSPLAEAAIPRNTVLGEATFPAILSAMRSKRASIALVASASDSQQAAKVAGVIAERRVVDSFGRRPGHVRLTSAPDP